MQSIIVGTEKYNMVMNSKLSVFVKEEYVHFVPVDHDEMNEKDKINQENMASNDNSEDTLL